ncbi:MAG TPA: response regulator [bacterium]|nr:response regulator [bacterium]
MTVTDREGLASLKSLPDEKIRSVLIVETDPLLADSIAQTVNQASETINVATAQTEAQCLAQIKDSEFDCVLLDLDLLSTNGSELIALIKDSRPHIPLVAMTSEPALAVRAIEGGATGFFLKSMDLAALRLLPQSMRNAVELARMRESLPVHAAKLHESAEDLRCALEDSPLAMIDLAPGGKVLHANGAALSLLGYGNDELLGAHIEDIAPETGRGRIADCLTQSQSGAAPSVEATFLTKQGGQLTVHVRAAAIRCPGHGIVKTRLFVSDMTGMKQIEEQLVQAQKMASIGELTAGVVHDFNNMLATIVLASQMINMEIPNDSMLRRQAQSIQSSAESGAHLASQLLSFARAARSESKTVELNSVINDIVNLLSLSIGDSVSIEFNLEPNIKHILADRNQVAQIILNLALNARDAMPNGGTLSFSTENVSMTDRERCQKLGIQTGDYVRIAVSDTGVGIDKGALGKIFEPVFTTKDANGGTGLGLLVVRRIVERHNGGIEVSSELGKGARFSIYMPSSREREQFESDEPSLESLCGSERILVVDDKDGVRESVSQMLALWGYEVVNANDGASAIELYRQRKDDIDAVLMDLRMPGMDGIETHGRLKQIDDSVLVVLTSGYGNEQLVAKATKQGVAGFIKKPYKMEQLLSLLRELLDKRNPSDGASAKLLASQPATSSRFGTTDADS